MTATDTMGHKLAGQLFSGLADVDVKRLGNIKWYCLGLTPGPFVCLLILKNLIVFKVGPDIRHGLVDVGATVTVTGLLAADSPHLSTTVLSLIV